MAVHRQACGDGHLLYRKHVRLVGAQEAKKSLILWAIIYRYILGKAKTLILLPTSMSVCALDPMTFNELNSTEHGTGFMLYEVVTAKCRMEQC